MKQETKPAGAPIVYTDYPEYPFLVYNHKTRQTKAAQDKKHRDELVSEGFVDAPFPPEDPDAMTEAEVAQLQTLLAKAAKALAKLGRLSEKHDPVKE